MLTRKFYVFFPLGMAIENFKIYNSLRSFNEKSSTLMERFVFSSIY